MSFLKKIRRKSKEKTIINNDIKNESSSETSVLSESSDEIIENSESYDDIDIDINNFEHIIPSSSLYMDIYCGNCCTFSIDTNRNLVSFGYNEKGKLGHKINSSNTSVLPKIIENLNNIISISCGYFHSVCCDMDGNVFTFGDNSKGQLGVGKSNSDLSHTNIPQKINIPPVELVSCGYEFTVCLTNDGTLYSFGSGSDGQLGHGKQTLLTSPVQIKDLHNVEYMDCGMLSCICKTSEGFYSWGNGGNGQLGHSANVSINKPKLCVGWPDNIRCVRNGYTHVVLLTSTGHVYTFGSNSHGQLSVNDKKLNHLKKPKLVKGIPLVQKIASGYAHSSIIDMDNNFWICGSSCYNQTGLGSDNIYKFTQNKDLSDIIDLSHGGNHVFVKNINNEIYAFGNNSKLQLGEQGKKDKPKQVLIEKEDIWCSFSRKSRQKSARK